MKRVIMLLFLAIGVNYTTKAQSDQNFRICFVGGQYVACDADAPLTSAGSFYESSGDDMPDAVPVYMGSGTNKKSNMVVSFDDPNAAYQGDESAINDGVRKNKNRNINYLDAANPVPPNDGGLSNKK